jgi:hypothetical protein
MANGNTAGRVWRVAAVLGAATLSACAVEGDLTEESPSVPDQVPALFSLAGRVVPGVEEVAAESGLEVGVLWLRAIDFNQGVRVEATRADVLGTSLPADFTVALTAPPSEDLFGVYLPGYSESGSSMETVDRSRVAFGMVVVAEAGTFAALPETASFLEFIGSSGQPGPLMSAFTYVSPFGLYYVEGASAEGLVNRDINGVEYALQDFNLFDLRVWAVGVDTSLCQNELLGQGWSEPEVQDCIAAAGPDASGDIQNECLYAWYVDQPVDETCGPMPGPEADFRNATRLSSADDLTLTLGDTDLRSALSANGFIFLN